MKGNLILFSAAIMTWGLGEGVFILFQPLYLQKLGANPLMIGGILSAAGFAMTLAHIPAGYLADRIGRRPLLIAAWMVGTVAAILMASANSLWPFVAGLLLYGFTAFVTSPRRLRTRTGVPRGKRSQGLSLFFISWL
jgi:MFS family permease